jgi:hypothetical protein
VICDLTKFASQWEPENKKSSNGFEKGTCDKEWISRKTAILSRFTTSEKLSIMTSFLSGGEKGMFLH